MTLFTKPQQKLTIQTESWPQSCDTSCKPENFVAD